MSHDTRSGGGPEKPARGLPSIRKAKQEREKRPLRVGAIHGIFQLATKRPPLRAMAWFGLALVFGLLVYSYRMSNAIEKDRQALMADQRAVEVEMGSRFYPLREKVETLTASLAQTAAPELSETEDLEQLRFRGGQSGQVSEGIYLRLRLEEARSVDAMREAAKRSSKDGFTACLITGGAQPTASLAPCASANDCKAGELCNELDECAPPSQPFNWRLAQRSLQILSPEWVRAVQDASSDLRLRGMRATFDSAVKVDLPVAINIVTRADYLLVVLDERPAVDNSADPSKGPSSDDVADAEGARYFSRIGLFRLSDSKPLLRLRRDPEVNLHGMPAQDLAMEASRRRQARSCALALEVRGALDKTE